MKRIFFYVLLFSLTACTGDVIGPNPVLPDFNLLVDKHWNLKTSVKGGISTNFQGKWMRYTKVNTTTYSGPVYDDSDGNHFRVGFCENAIVSDFDSHRIEYLKKDSLVLWSMQNSTLYRFSTKN